MGSKPSKRSNKEGAVSSGKKKNQQHAATPGTSSESRSTENDTSADNSYSMEYQAVSPASRNRQEAHSPNSGILGRGTGSGGNKRATLTGEGNPDDRPFHEERVVRVPTKAVLKPLKNKDSVIADPSDEDESGYDNMNA